MQSFLNLFIVFLSGLVIGGGLMWLVARARYSSEAGWTDKFKALAADTLRANNEAFLQMAEGRLKQSEQVAAATLDKKTVAVDEMVKPVKETLQKMDAQLQALEVKREGAYRELLEVTRLTQQTHQQLRGETSQLLQALRAPTTRGAWGQMQLKRILEMTGMSTHAHDFSVQHTMSGEEGVLRPDFVVALPGDRCVVFDSKVPMTAYLEYAKNGEGAAQAPLLAQHAKQVREHIRALGNKEYWSQIETTPEFVVLFMPGDHLLGAALDSDPELMDFGIAQKVVLATPTTVIALLWAVAYGWKQEALRDNVRKIGSLGGELYNALLSMTRHLSELGGKLGGGVKAYNDALGSFDRNVLSKARRLRDYGAAKDGKVLPEVLEPIDLQPRSLTVRETPEGEEAA
jgi:DNA recombination protein RmuC